MLVCVLEREGDGEREMIEEKCDLGGCEGVRQGSDKGDKCSDRRGREAARGQWAETHREAVIREVAAVRERDGRVRRETCDQSERETGAGVGRRGSERDRQRACECERQGCSVCAEEECS